MSQRNRSQGQRQPAQPLAADLVYERPISLGHFAPGDRVHILISPLDAATTSPEGLPSYEVTPDTSPHCAGATGLWLRLEEQRILASPRYLIHNFGCADCTAFRVALIAEITAADFGDSDPSTVMLYALTDDNQLIHIHDALLLEG